jgi:glycosyltransferase involved in cell wall biosynthesis
MPFVSVIIPAYNYDEYIRQAVESVLAQSFADLEILVVDDGSIDNTRQVVEQIEDSRLRYLYQDNQGLSSARNTGLRCTDSKYVAFLDADDLWLPSKLELQLGRIERSDRIGLVYGGYHVIDEAGVQIGTRSPRIVDGDWLKHLVLGNFVAGSATTSMLRRECFERVGLFDESLRACEDWDMWLRVAQYYEFGVVDAPMAAIRIHTANMTADSDLMDRYFQIVLDKFFRNLDLPPEIVRLQQTARARAKVASAVFAARRSQYTKVTRLALAALRYDVKNMDAYYVIVKSVLRAKV